MEKKKNQFFELLKNKRSRAAIILGFYFIIFIVLIGAIRSNERELQEKPESKETNFSQLNNYEAEYQFLGEEEIILNGTHYQNKEVFFTSNNEEFYLENEHFYQVINQKLQPISTTVFQFNILKLQPRELSTLLKYSTLKQTTNYQDHRTRKIYEIAIPDFLKWYNGTFSSQEEMILIETEETNSMINKITLDLTSYHDKKIIITYKNINQITGLETNYE